MAKDKSVVCKEDHVLYSVDGLALKKWLEITSVEHNRNGVPRSLPVSPGLAYIADLEEDLYKAGNIHGLPAYREYGY
ncbi:hypothetical protein CDAR_199131 [Caerostris darwini]|uniref:Uncharacterized protein n=1 Tax=Caerostris darwini TaxID=1538125 RepID=A0AAV4VFS8_9ARAC|nr:hypothetical protein CDAR_199131 [Caerostris darwini]